MFFLLSPTFFIPLAILLIACLALTFAYWRYRREVPVVMYHRVADVPGNRLAVPADMFTEQMDYLQQQGFHSISLDELYNYYLNHQPLPTKPIVITFDDGFDDNYTTALPILLQHRMTACVCIISGWIDQDNNWEEYRGKTVAHTMNWEQIRYWRDAGMGIVCHTVNHPRLNRLNEATITCELSESKRTLEEELGLTIDFFCYPYGDYDDRVQRIAQQIGFKGALAIFDRAPLWHFDPYAIRRIAISSRQPLHEFARKVSPWHFIFLLMRKVERIMHRQAYMNNQ